jgi:predicted acylesterase/phospholipase RssA
VPLGRYHVKTVELTTLERQLLKALTRTPDLLSARQEAQMRWALALGRVCLLRAPSGQDIELADELESYRLFLTTRLKEVLPSSGQVDAARLRHHMPTIAQRLAHARARLLEHHAQDFGAEDLDQELRFRKVALALGGGGGSGFAHLGIFLLLHELGIVPELIVGASMGSLLGLFRALSRTFSPNALLHTVPRSFDWNNILSPFTGAHRFGFPGLFYLHLMRPSAEALESLTGFPRIPRLSELPIRLELVTTGVRTGFPHKDEVERELAQAHDASLTPFALRRRFQFLVRTARNLASDARFLKEIVFGATEETRNFNAVEAVGFSCSVPGLFCYDVLHDDPDTVGTLEDLSRRHSLWRFTDGGVVNNVPARVAWESVMRGNLKTRNVFVLGSDVFAPINSPANIFFTPIQQIVRNNVLSNRPYSNFTHTFSDPPSPINLLPGWKRMQAMADAAREELNPVAPLLRRALATLPPFAEIAP